MIYFFLIIAAGIVVAFILTGILRSRLMRRAMWSKSPFPEAGGTGVLEGLNPVEAGIVMSLDPSRLLTMYLLDLVSFSDIAIASERPLRVEVTAGDDMPEYSKRFIEAVNEDGSLDPEKMLLALDTTYTELGKKIIPYSVKKTVIYYLDKVDEIWDRIWKERTSSARLDTLEAKFPWLLLHENALDQLEESFKNSARWPDVRPIVNLYLLIRRAILNEVDLIRHAADHPEGILSHKTYWPFIVDIAKRHVYRGKSIFKSPPIVTNLIDSMEHDKLLNERLETMNAQLEENLKKLQPYVNKILEHEKTSSS